MFEGTVEGLRASDTLTGRHLDDRASIKDTVRTSSEALRIRSANANNLQATFGLLCAHPSFQIR